MGESHVLLPFQALQFLVLLLKLLVLLQVGLRIEVFLPVLRQKCHKPAFFHLVFLQFVGDFIFEIGVQLSNLDDFLQKMLILGSVLF